MTRRAIRSAYLSFKGDPASVAGDADCYTYEADGLVVMEEGRICWAGPASDGLNTYGAGLDVEHYSDGLLLAGFIDAHVHYPQTPIIGSYGEQLLTWLNTYTFPAERAFEDADYGRLVADVFLDECLRSGTTTAAVYCTVHPQSVNSFFEAADARGLCMIAGKALMDQNVPDYVRDTAQSGYEQSKELIDRWHGRGRALYAVTPRFAPSCSHAQMELAATLWRETPGAFLQSHISENVDELKWVAELFPNHRDYLAVYESYGMLGPRAIYGHGIHLSKDELRRMGETGTAIAHCPSSNSFLGSGLFDLSRVRSDSPRVPVAIGTDVGAGTSLSMLRTLGDAYKVAQLAGSRLSALDAFYMASLGAAKALQLDASLGSIDAGKDADLIVLDPKCTPLMAFRSGYADSLEDLLFVLMTLGDDRAVKATYVGGQRLHMRAP